MHNVGMLSIDLQKLVLTMTATVESTTVKSPAVKPATVEFAACGIAVTFVIPPTVETSRQAEGYNQKHAKDNQLYFHYLMRRQAGRMTSGAEDIRLAIANPIPRAAPVTTATLPESPFMTVLPCLISP
jgi:hypothetical protein